jgi:6-phosphogluconolactonase (cycloisomerase 2 family)
VNPSFLTLDHQRRFLHSAHGDDEHATAFAIDRQTGRLEMLNQDSDTIVPFHIDQSRGTLTPTGQVIQTGSPSSIVFA